MTVPSCAHVPSNGWPFEFEGCFMTKAQMMQDF